MLNYVMEQTHVEAFGGPPLCGSGLPKMDRYGEFGCVGTRAYIRTVAPPGTTQHQGRHVVTFSQAEEVNVQVATQVQPSMPSTPPRL